ncbi:MAG: DNRLRE domain-containing protein [Firmicutes bacterium]|nr:DNRLRE domain-containing protein [Bacillota bacterium]
MLRLSRAKRFKFLVILVLLVTFLNLGLPLNAFAAQAAYAEQQRSIGSEESPGFFATVLDGIANFFSSVGKAIKGLGKSITNFVTSIGKDKNAPDIPEKTLNSKTTNLGNGKYRTEVYSEPIHFKNSDGELQDIDNSLVESKKEGFAFENKANSFKVFFAENTISNNLVRVVSGKHTVEWKLLDVNNVKGVEKGSSITYSGVFAGVDIKYTVENTKVKEDIVLHNANTPTSFRFELGLKNLYYIQEKGGSISFYDQVTKEKIWLIEKPFMYDANGEESQDITVSIKDFKGKSYLTLAADRDWLKSKDRKYPVILDPTIHPGASDGRDTFVSSRYPNTDYKASSYLRAGYISSYGTTISFLWFSAIDDLAHGNNVTVENATLSLTNTYGTGGPVAAHRVYDYWANRYNTSYTVTWNQRPGYDPNAAAYEYYAPWDGEFKFNITNLVQGWLRGSYPNYGIALDSSGGYRRYYSSDSGSSGRPKLEIDYWIDTTPPDIYLNYPDNDIVSGASNIEVYTEDDSGVSWVSCYVGGRYVGGGGGSISVPWNTKAFSDGTYTVYIQASDIYGHVSSTQGTVIIDNNAPQVSITSPVSGSTLTNSVPINISASDAGAGVAYIDLYINDELVDTLYGAPYTYNWQTTEFPAGLYTIKAEAFDGAGRKAVSSLVDIKLDHDGPSIQIVSPAAGEYICGVVPVQFEAFDDLGVVQAKLYVDGFPQGAKDYALFFDPEFLRIDSFDLDTTKLIEGKHNLSVVVKDIFGRESIAEIQITVDNTDPTGDITYPGNAQAVRQIVPIEVLAGDTLSGIDKVEYYVDNNLSETLYDAPYIYEWDTKSVEDGNHTLLTKIYDFAGNVISRQVTVSVDNTAPIPAINAPVSGAVLQGLALISGFAADNLVLDKIRLKVEKLGGGYEKDFAATSAGSGSWIWDTSMVRDGEYTLMLDASDTAGNTAVAKINVIVKNIPDELGVKGFLTYHNQQMTYFDTWVNAKSGNLTLKRTDLDIAGRLPTSVTRTYNSQAKGLESLGYGWHLNVGAYLSEYASGNIEILDASGTKLLFTKRSDGTFAAPAGIYDTLTKNSDGMTTTYTLTYQNKIKDIFDYDGSLIRTEDLNGNYIAYDYDERGRLAAIVDDAGRTYSFAYQADGLIESITDPAGQKIVYAYNDRLDLVQVTDQAGNISTYTYDDNHNLISFTDGTFDASGNPNKSRFEYADGKVVSFIDPLGNKTTYSYDSANRQMVVADALGHKTTYTYNEAGNPVFIVDPLGAKTSFEFENNNLIATIDAKGGKASYVYDSAGNMVETVDTLGRITLYAYDINNKPITITYPDNTTTRYVYDEAGNLLQETDALGKTTTYTYDEYGNRTSTTDALGATTIYTYDEAGNVTSATDSKGSTTTFSYDVLGQLTTIEDPLGNTTSYDYDALGNRTSVTDANGATTTYTYDANGQVVKEIDALGATTTYTYDGNGNVASSTDDQGNTIAFAYDAAGNKVSETDPLGNTTVYQYDAAGNVTKTTDPEGRTTVLSYDSLGQVESVSTPEGAKTGYNYDSEGNLIAQTDPNGGTTSYTYDKNNQVTETKDPLGYLAKFEYDANGNITKTTDFNGASSTSVYDAAGNVVAITDATGASTSYVYDATGNLVSITDPRGNKTEYTYDALGRVTAETDPLGNTERYEFDGVGNLIAQTDAMGNKSSYTYDANGNLTKETDPYGNSTSFVYDSLGNLTAEVDPEGNKTTYTYDANGQLTSETDGEGNTDKYTYSASGDLTSETNSRGLTTSYTYDSQGNVLSVTDPLGNTEKYTYDGMGNMTSEVDGLGNKTTYGYDKGGNLLSEIDPLGAITKYTYDAAGEVLSETDALGNTTTYEYDANGNITKETDQLGNSTTYAYDPMGNVTKEVDPLGRTISREYDAAGNMVSETNALGETTRYSYDGNGNVKQEIDPQGNIITYSYDANDNIKSETDALGNTTAFTYDGNGNIISATDPSGLVTTYTYDANDNLTSVTDPSGNTTKYTYDGEENLTSVTDPMGQVTTYTYDANDNLASITDSLGNTTKYTYDPNGQLTSMTNANGQTTTYTYDKAGKLTQITYPDGSTVEYTYNAAGDMVSKVDSSGTTSYSYDAAGKLTSQTEPDGTKVEYTYNGAGDMVAKKVNGESSNYSYDESGRISSMTISGGTIYFTYDKAGNRTSIKYPDGTTTAMEYDAAGRLAKIETTNPSGTALSSTTYTYDRQGNRIEITNEKGTHKYTYDKAGQLTSATYPDGRSVSYTYDKAGNRTSLDVTVAFNGVAPNGKKKGIEEIVQDVVASGKVSGNKSGLRETIQAVLLGTYTDGNKSGIKETILASVNGYTVSIATYAYNEASQLVRAEYPILPVVYEYTYDKSGNMVSDGQKAYSYDSEGRLTSIKDKTKTITYTYDEKGFRKSISVNGKKSFFHYVGERLAYETDASGATTKSFAYDDEGRAVSFTYSGETYYYITDGQASVIGLIDSSGNQIVTYSYDAFGNLADIEGDVGLAKANPLRYAGYYFDEDASLYYLVSRYYDPSIGRFISKDSEQADPVDPATINPYTYCANNPVNYFDPDGKRYKSYHKKQAKEFFGIKNMRPGASTRVKSSKSTKAKGEFHSAVSSLLKKKVTYFNVGSQKVKVTKYGSRYMKASSRGEKPRLSKKESSKKTKYTRAKSRDIKSLNKDIRKNRVRVKGQVSRGAKRMAVANKDEVGFEEGYDEFKKPKKPSTLDEIKDFFTGVARFVSLPTDLIYRIGWTAWMSENYKPADLDKACWEYYKWVRDGKTQEARDLRTDVQDALMRAGYPVTEDPSTWGSIKKEEKIRIVQLYSREWNKRKAYWVSKVAGKS